MARTLLADGLWERIRRLLPQHPERPGRPWVDDRPSPALGEGRVTRQ